MRDSIDKSELRGRVSVPTSKSYTIRGLMCAALAKGESRIIDFLASDDTEAATNVLRQIGARIDQKGDLWIGCHPKLLTFVKYSKDPQALSPSQVIKVAQKPSGQYDINVIYLNEGRPLSGSSVGAVFKDTLLIGSVFDERFLLCRMQK